MKCVIDKSSIDRELGHVTFTVHFDDGTTHTETKGDLHYWDEIVSTQIVPERTVERLVADGMDENGAPINRHTVKEVIPEHTVAVTPHIVRHRRHPRQALREYVKLLADAHNAEVEASRPLGGFNTRDIVIEE